VRRLVCCNSRPLLWKKKKTTKWSIIEY